ETEEERNKTFANWAFFQFFAASLISLILICFSSFFSLQLTGIPDYHLLFIIAALNFPLWSFQKVVNMWYRLKRKAWGAVFFALFTTLFTLVFSIVFVVKYGFGIIGVFYAQLSASLLAFIFAVYTMRIIFRPRNLDVARLKKMLAFSFPLVPAAICTWVLSSAGSYFIKYIKGTGEVGLFQIGVNIASLANIMISA